MPQELRESQRDLREALKLVAVTLKQGDAPFALTGGYALWARGGPEPEHDVDFMVAEADAPLVMARLAEQGLQVVQPPEDWLFKVFVGEGQSPPMVDILFRSAGETIERSHFAVVEQPRGDIGLREVLNDHPEWVAAVEVAEPIADVDTSDDLRALERHGGG